MNTNPLEKQLESWVPRRPSAAVKQRIFATAPTEAKHGLTARVLSRARTYLFTHEGSQLPGWVKFAPACGILLVIMVLSMGRQEKSAYFAVASGSNALASLSSNLLVVCATDTREQRQNVWTAATFDWTKDARSMSTRGSFPAGNTNKL
jgi:hypothetical protein